MQAFNKACNYISIEAFDKKKFGQIDLHHLYYYHIRDIFKLSSQMAIRAIRKVAESYKANKSKVHIFKEYSAIVYDQRILSFKGLDLVSILSINGRLKVPILVGSYAKLDQRRVRGQADLIYTNKEFFLCLCVEVPEEVQFEPNGSLGVDFGIINLATTSDGVSFSGADVEKTRKNISKLRGSLQRKRTKSAKRHLVKLSGKERKFKRNTNHIISKRIVQIAKDTQRAIVLEDLKGFRATVRTEQREQFGKWAFYELRQFIKYKAQLAGIPLFIIDPKNTSRTCSKCGYIAKSSRKSQSEFTCIQCNFSLNADINGAMNIASRAPVNVPIVAGFSNLSYKLPALAGGS